MIVRNDTARKSQFFSKLSLILIDQEKENTSVIMIQPSFRIYKIHSQHKNRSFYFMYAKICKAYCCTK